MFRLHLGVLIRVFQRSSFVSASLVWNLFLHSFIASCETLIPTAAGLVNKQACVVTSEQLMDIQQSREMPVIQGDGYQD
jgi:hypothetical protein